MVRVLTAKEFSATYFQIPVSNGSRFAILRDLRSSGRRRKALAQDDPFELFGGMLGREFSLGVEAAGLTQLPPVHPVVEEFGGRTGDPFAIGWVGYEPRTVAPQDFGHRVVAGYHAEYG